MDEISITRYITEAFPGVGTTENLGYTFFYADDRMLPFATLARNGNAYESISKLDRPGVFRLNIGISKNTFQSLFGEARVDVSSFDYAAIDVIMPHPDYASQSFICVLSPSESTFARIRPLLAEAYDLAVKRYDRRKAR